MSSRALNSSFMEAMAASMRATSRARSAGSVWSRELGREQVQRVQRLAQVVAGRREEARLGEIGALDLAVALGQRHAQAQRLHEAVLDVAREVDEQEEGDDGRERNAPVQRVAALPVADGGRGDERRDEGEIGRQVDRERHQAGHHGAEQHGDEEELIFDAIGHVEQEASGRPDAAAHGQRPLHAPAASRDGRYRQRAPAPGPRHGRAHQGVDAEDGQPAQQDGVRDVIPQHPDQDQGRRHARSGSAAVPRHRGRAPARRGWPCRPPATAQGRGLQAPARAAPQSPPTGGRSAAPSGRAPSRPRPRGHAAAPS